MQKDMHYHIYNRANGSENLFRSDKKYRYSLRQYEKYIQPISDTYAYCLMANHFHFLLKIKGAEELQQPSRDSKPLESSLSYQFSHFFHSYTQPLNKYYGRKGGLFSPSFKRKEIDSDEYLVKLIHYIHHNPVNHGFVSEIIEWPYSSYNRLILDKPTLLRRAEVIIFFDTLDYFIYCHQHPPELTGIG